MQVKIYPWQAKQFNTPNSYYQSSLTNIDLSFACHFAGLSNVNSKPISCIKRV